MFDPNEKTAEACADFLFRWQARRILARWWRARGAGAAPERMRELAGDALLLLLDYDGRPHPYVRAQLGTALRLSKAGDALDYGAAVRLARADLAASAVH